jgi:hypothetical protein
MKHILQSHLVTRGATIRVHLCVFIHVCFMDFPRLGSGSTGVASGASKL